MTMGIPYFLALLMPDDPVEGNDLSRIPGQAPIAHPAIAPQVLDDPQGMDPQGMFDPSTEAVAPGVEGALRTTQPAAGLAQDAPLHLIGFGLPLTLRAHIRLVAMDDLFCALGHSPS